MPSIFSDWFISKEPELEPASSPQTYASPSSLFNDIDSPFEEQQPLTPQDESPSVSTKAMPVTSPINITRTSSSSPSSPGVQTINYHDTDSRTSAMMTGTAFDSSMGRGRHDSFAGAKPISMNNPNRNGDQRQRRESLAGSLVGGMSWGGVSVGSWIRDE